MSRQIQDEPEHEHEHGEGQGQGQDVSEPLGNCARTRFQVPPVTQLPPEVAEEIAMYLRSQLFAPISTNIGQMKSGCEIMIAAQKDVLQEAQAQTANVIEPVAADLVPIAKELEKVYRQIDLLEGLVNRVNTSIKRMASRVEKTEQTLRREERALDEGRPVEVWKEGAGGGPGEEFRARDWVEGGVLKER
ncbi:hypothetical protein EV426DRAFT_98597 [Tirmania nivea]|nr:hypothetical protein EV426DRAFT_98597 [Tirmania nivea]